MTKCRIREGQFRGARRWLLVPHRTIFEIPIEISVYFPLMQSLEKILSKIRFKNITLLDF